MKGARLLRKAADPRTWAGNIQDKPGEESEKEKVKRRQARNKERRESKE